MWTAPAKEPERRVKIKELPTSEQPVTRLKQYGPRGLSSTELLGIVLGTQEQLYQGQELLREFRGLGNLANASPAEIERATKGVGLVTAARVLAALELGKRINLERPEDLLQIRTPADAANTFSDMYHLDHEEFRVAVLGTKNHVLRAYTLYKGSVNTSLLRVGEVFREAIRWNGVSIVLAHNHPSGDPSPSPEDVSVTRQIIEAGSLFDIEVLDHIIIGKMRFISMKERGLAFSE